MNEHTSAKSTRNVLRIALAFLLSLTLCAGLLPSGALAADVAAQEDTAKDQTAQAAEASSDEATVNDAQDAAVNDAQNAADDEVQAGKPAAEEQSAVVPLSTDADKPAASDTVKASKSAEPAAEASAPAAKSAAKAAAPAAKEVTQQSILANQRVAADQPGRVGQAIEPQEGMTALVQQAAKLAKKTVTGTYAQSQARSILDMVNAARAKEGVPALKWNSSLEATAKLRAAELTELFSHSRPDGTMCPTAFPSGCVYVGENIAAGYSSAASVNAGWTSSPGHYNNMVSKNFTTIGIACFVHDGVPYWVEVFASGLPATGFSSAADNSKRSVTFNVPFQADIAKASIKASQTSYNYDGKAKKPTFTIKANGQTLKAGTHYTVTYKNNVNPGTATATIKGKGDYTGTKTVNYTIRRSIAKATVSVASTLPYSGKALKPAVTVKLAGKTLKSGTDYTVAYKNNTGSKKAASTSTATVTVTGKGNYYGSVSKSFKIKTPSIQYYVHRQTYGWEAKYSKKDGASSGTTGQKKRLEGIYVRLANKPVSGSIQYRTHVQKIGWQGWKKEGQMSGTAGKKYRLEAIQIKLTGEMAKKYDVYYRVHAQKFGWMGWAKNGASAGTAGYAYRLESIQIKLVPKGQAAPGTTTGAFYNKLALVRSWTGVAMSTTGPSGLVDIPQGMQSKKRNGFTAYKNNTCKLVVEYKAFNGTWAYDSAKNGTVYYRFTFKNVRDPYWAGGVYSDGNFVLMSRHDNGVAMILR